MSLATIQENSQLTINSASPIVALDFCTVQYITQGKHDSIFKGKDVHTNLAPCENLINNIKNMVNHFVLDQFATNGLVKSRKHFKS